MVHMASYGPFIFLLPKLEFNLIHLISRELKASLQVHFD